jgi:hypothetical protein
MMQPLPRPIGRKKFRSEVEQPGKKPAGGGKGQLIAAAALGGVAVTVLVVAALWTDVSAKPIPPGTVRPVEKIVERDNHWFEGAPDNPAAERMRQRLESNPNLRLSHREVKTGLVRINLRTVESVPPPPPADGKKSLAPPPERSTSLGSAPRQPGSGNEEPPPVTE